MSAPHIILDNLPSLCQKLSDLVEVWRSYNKNNFACFLRHGVYSCILQMEATLFTQKPRDTLRWLSATAGLSCTYYCKVYIMLYIMLHQQLCRQIKLSVFSLARRWTKFYFYCACIGPIGLGLFHETIVVWVLCLKNWKKARASNYCN